MLEAIAVGIIVILATRNTNNREQINQQYYDNFGSPVSGAGEHNSSGRGGGQYGGQVGGQQARPSSAVPGGGGGRIAGYVTADNPNKAPLPEQSQNAPLVSGRTLADFQRQRELNARRSAEVAMKNEQDRAQHSQELKKRNEEIRRRLEEASRKSTEALQAERDAREAESRRRLAEAAAETRRQLEEAQRKAAEQAAVRQRQADATKAQREAMARRAAEKRREEINRQYEENFRIQPISYGGRSGNGVRTADFQDGNDNGVDDRDERPEHSVGGKYIPPGYLRVGNRLVPIEQGKSTGSGGDRSGSTPETGDQRRERINREYEEGFRIQPVNPTPSKDPNADYKRFFRDYQGLN